MKPIKARIKDIDWIFIVLTDEQYEKKYGNGSQGLTDKNELAVFFKESYLSQKLVSHELFHVYVGSCCTNSIDNLDADAMEELAAEIVEYHLEDIQKYSKKIYNTLKDGVDK